MYATNQLVEIQPKVVFPEWYSEKLKHDLGKESSMDK